MSPYIEKFEICDKDKVNNLGNYLDSIDLGDKEIVSFPDTRNINTKGRMMNISTGIASAVTAYARINIHKSKLFAGDSLLYTDTDSIFTTKPLPSHMVGTELGLMKQEYDLFSNGTPCKAGVFLAPKVYGLILPDGSEKIVIKGYNGNDVTFNDLLALLNKDSKLTLTQNKWFRSYSNATVTIRDTVYTLMVTDSKRQLIYVNGKLSHSLSIIQNSNGLLPLALPYLK